MGEGVKPENRETEAAQKAEQDRDMAAGMQSEPNNQEMEAAMQDSKETALQRAAEADCDMVNEPESRDMASMIERQFGLAQKDIRTYSPLTLAYIGDSIYDLVIRTMLVGKGNAPVNSLHRRASSMVKAESQKTSFYRIERLLTEEEQSVYRRGRNAKSYTTAKNASVSDYRIATGFEALMGYLYLTGQTERLLYLAEVGLADKQEAE